MPSKYKQKMRVEAEQLMCNNISRCSRCHREEFPLWRIEWLAGAFCVSCYCKILRVVGEL